MPQIIFLLHEELCPEGAAIEAPTGETVLDVALKNGISIPHACEKSCACTTCHVIVREGFDSLEESDELEAEEKGEPDPSRDRATARRDECITHWTPHGSAP